MKKLVFITMLCVFAIGLNAQEMEEGRNDDGVRTLFNEDSFKGGYGAFDVRYGMLDDRDAVVIGGKGVWLLNHSFGIGAAGYGFITDFDQEVNLDLHHNLQGGYGGLYFEPIIAPKSPVHFSVPLFFGVGGVAYTTVDKYDNDHWGNDWDDDDDYYVEDWDAFFIFKPGVEVEMNVLKFFRLGFGGYYNFTTDIDVMETKKDAIQGWEAGISLKFGVF